MDTTLDKALNAFGEHSKKYIEEYIDNMFKEKDKMQEFHIIDYPAKVSDLKEIKSGLITVESEDPMDPRLLLEHTDVLEFYGDGSLSDSARPMFRIIDQNKWDKIKHEIELIGKINYVRFKIELPESLKNKLHEMTWKNVEDETKTSKLSKEEQKEKYIGQDVIALKTSGLDRGNKHNYIEGKEYKISHWWAYPDETMGIEGYGNTVYKKDFKFKNPIT